MVAVCSCLAAVIFERSDPKSKLFMMPNLAWLCLGRATEDQPNQPYATQRVAPLKGSTGSFWRLAYTDLPIRARPITQSWTYSKRPTAV